jgi:hypothetical protein
MANDHYPAPPVAPGSRPPQTPLEARWNLPAASPVQYDRNGAPIVAPIYIGTTNTKAYLGSTFSNVNFQDTFIPKEQAWTLWQSLDEQGAKRLSAAMDKLYPNGWDSSYIQNIWSRGVATSERELVQTGQRISPIEAVEMIAANPTLAGLSRDSGNGFGGTSVTRQVRLTDPDTARGLVDAALQTYLGQRASPEETTAFLQALKAHEQKNATVQTTTTTGKQGDSQTNISISGGSSAQQFAQDWARAQPGSAEFQAVTSYLDEFMKAIQNPMDVVS